MAKFLREKKPTSKTNNKPPRSLSFKTVSFSKTYLTIFAVVFASVGGYFLLKSFAASPTDTTTTADQGSYRCAGVPADAPRTMYPEPRIYLEDQSWVTPTPGHTMDEPFPDRTGHLHMATCWPLYQTVSSDTMPLDLKWQIHAMGGTGLSAFNLWDRPENDFARELRGSGVYKPSQGGLDENFVCPTVQCQGWVHDDFPVKGDGVHPNSGWRQFNIFHQAIFPNPGGDPNLGDQLWGYTHWWVKLDNGNPVFPPNPDFYDCRNIQNGECYDDMVGAGQWRAKAIFDNNAQPRIYSIFSRTNIEKLWNIKTGELVPLSGTVHLNFFSTGNRARVMIDPAFHANPPVAGMVLSDGTNTAPGFDIDTTKLAPGPHRLVMQATEQCCGFEWAGLNVIPFLVVNPNPPTTDTTPPSTPTGLSGVAVSDTKINLSWAASTDNFGVMTYDIYRNSIKIGESTITNYSDTNLKTGTSYSYSVKARDYNSNASPASNTVTIVAQSNPSSDTIPPTTPSNLTASAASSTQVNLSWTASTDNVGVAGYDIFRNGVKINEAQSTPFVDKSANPSTAYNYYVKAKDAAGNLSVASNIAGVTTPGNPGTKTGDLNGDGQVGIIDLSILLSHYGQTTTTGDCNGDGIVGVVDLSILLSNFGK